MLKVFLHVGSTNYHGHHVLHGLDLVAVMGVVVGLCMVMVMVWVWVCGGRKMGGGGVRRFNIQHLKFNKV